MQFTRRIAATAAVGSLVLAVGIAPAGAQESTTTTFTITSGALSVTVPANASLGSVDTASASLEGALGTVRVDDLRGDLDSSWVATAVASDFTTGGGTADETIAASAFGYEPGLITRQSGAPVSVGTIVSGLTSAKTVVSTTATGENAVSWNPTVTVTVPDTGVVAGQYSGTITHSVS